jgi:predicted metal-dependent phosphoesterase TrpH
MDGRADLHLHTHYSDGALSPHALLAIALRAGLTIISITDHDNTGALPEARALGASMGIEVITGVELSATMEGQDIHILGYFINEEDPSFQEHLLMFRHERHRRAERIVQRLHDLGIPLQFEAVLVQAGMGSIGRPHVAAALVQGGYVDSYQEAFSRFLSTGKPAYEKKYQISVREAIALIANAGGLSFVAHPGNFFDERVLLTLIKEGVDGIEVVHPSHSTERMTYYRGIAEEYFLLTSGGSDFHGGRKNDDDVLGRFAITAEAVNVMRRRLRQTE